jgi:hypothetical protein
MTDALFSVRFLPPSHSITPAATSRPLWWALLGSGCALLLFPLMLVDVPPLLDYPNHLARAFILAQGDDDPLLASMYGPRWAIIPNLATDVILPPLILALPVHIAGRLLIGFAMLLPVAGGVLFSRALFGRHTVWALGTCLVTANGLFLLGFINFQIGIGLAPICAAVWLHWRERRPILLAAFGAVAAGALFFSHLMGLLFFGLMIGCYEWDYLAKTRRDHHLAVHACRRMLVLLPATGVSVGLYWASSFGTEASAIVWGSLDQRLIRALPFFGYDLAVDLASTALIVSVLVMLVWQGKLLVPRSSVFLLAMLTALAMLAPLGFKGTGYVHARFAVMLAIMLFAAIRPVDLSRKAAWLIGGTLTSIFVVQEVQTVIVWHGHAHDIAELRRVTASVQPGSRILTTAIDIDEASIGRRGFLSRQMLADGTRLDGHVAALLVIERRAFWPFLFANAAQQPLQMREPYLAIGERTVSIPNLRQLRALAPDGARGGPFPIAGQWPFYYDYVLLVPAGAHPGFTDPTLEPVARSDYADLFRVRPAASLASLP